MPGTLFIVATPIGNLEDITLRAVRILKEADLIAAEDTRHTATLLRHYDIRTPTTSFHEHNEKQKLAAIMARLTSGQRVALVSDAGTPGISDPGYRLVHAAREAGIPVEVLPGPSAVVAALVGSGLPTDSFTFLGFPPIRSNARERWLRQVADSPRTIVFFEAPHRLISTIKELQALVAPERVVAVARELTKLHEELVVSPISEVAGRLAVPPKGELTIVVAPADAQDDRPGLPDPARLLHEFGQLTDLRGMERREAVRELSHRYGVSSREVYSAIERARNSVD